MVEIRLAHWPEKYFSGQSTRRSSGVNLSPSYTKWFSSSIDLVVWPVQMGSTLQAEVGKRRDSREEFQEKKR